MGLCSSSPRTPSHELDKFVRAQKITSVGQPVAWAMLILEISCQSWESLRCLRILEWSPNLAFFHVRPSRYCPLGSVSQVQGVIVSGPPLLFEVDVVVNVFMGEG